MAQHTPTYEVFVDASGVDLAVDSPLRTPDIQYYDSGIWVDREDDRVFVPYRRVDFIRELPARTVAESTERVADPPLDASADEEPDVSGESRSEPPSEPVE